MTKVLGNTPPDFSSAEPPATTSVLDASQAPSTTSGNYNKEPEEDYMQVDTEPVYSKKKARESSSASTSSQTPTNTAATSTTTSTTTRITRTRGANASSISNTSSHTRIDPTANVST